MAPRRFKHDIWVYTDYIEVAEDGTAQSVTKHGRRAPTPHTLESCLRKVAEGKWRELAVVVEEFPTEDLSWAVKAVET